MKNIVNFVLKHSKVILFIIFVLTVFFGFNAIKININSNYMNLIPEDEELSQIKQEVLGNQESEFNQDFYFMVSGDNLFNKDTFNKIDEVLTRLSSYDQLSNPVSGESMVTAVKKGTRIAISPMSTHKRGEEWTDEEVLEYKENLLNDDIMKGLLVTEDGSKLFYYFNSKPASNEVVEQWLSIINELTPYCDYVSYGGGGPLEISTNNYLFADLQVLIAIGFLVILIIFFVSFHSFRAVLIPLFLSAIGLIWTLGTMVLLDYELTLVNIVIPCMVLILGSSYSVHVLNEYFRTYNNDYNNPNLLEAYSKIGKTIFMACITTIIGFLSLLICDLETFRQMGIAVSIGILYCAILSITLIPAWLNLIMKPRKIQMKQYKIGGFTFIENKLPPLVIKYYPIFIIVFILIALSFFFTYDKIETETNYMEYFPQDDKIIKDFKDLAVSFGSTTPYYIILDAPEGETNYFKDSDNLKKVFEFENALIRDDKDILHITSTSQYVAFLNRVYSGEKAIPDSNGLINMLSRYLILMENSLEDSSLIEGLQNKEATRIKLQINYYDSEKMNQPSIQCAQRLNDAIEKNINILDPNINITAWSDASAGLNLYRIMKSDQFKSTLLSFVLVFLFVTILFKSLSEGLFTMIPVVTGILGNYIFMYIAGIPFDIVTSIFSSIAIGVGVDDAIHFMLRYNQQGTYYKDKSCKDKIISTLEETIRPISLTSISIISGMLVMLFASYSPIRYFGTLLAVALFVTTIATLVLLPSFILLFDNVKNRIFKKKI